MDDIMLSHNGRAYATRIGHVLKVTYRTVAWRAKSDIYDCFVFHHDDDDDDDSACAKRALTFG